jgi:cytochrome c biogenesis factor
VKKVQRQPISAQELVTNPAIILAIAAILLIIGAIGPWARGAFGVGSLSGWDAGGGKLTLFIALMMVGTSVVSLGYLRSPTLERAFPMLSVSTVTGLIVFVGSLSWMTGRSGWGLYLTLVAGLVALFAAFMAYRQMTGFGRGPGLGPGRGSGL